MPTSAVQDLLLDLPVIDDTEAEWPKTVLLAALGFPSSARKVLCEYYWQDRSTVSLREIFELLISSQKDPRPGYIISPLLDFRNIGRKSVLGVVGHIGTLDLGRRCDAAWKEKYTAYLHSHRMKGSGKYSWSFPISEGGKWPVRIKGAKRHRS
jgi:hypothetical protein